MQDREAEGEAEGEAEELDVCAACGTQIHADSERAFAFGDENFLCARCAVARGGRYDAERDEWHATPDLTGLPDEAYGASPHERRGRRPPK